MKNYQYSLVSPVKRERDLEIRNRKINVNSNAITSRTFYLQAVIVKEGERRVIDSPKILAHPNNHPKLFSFVGPLFKESRSIRRYICAFVSVKSILFIGSFNR